MSDLHHIPAPHTLLPHGIGHKFGRAVLAGLINVVLIGLMVALAQVVSDLPALEGFATRVGVARDAMGLIVTAFVTLVFAVGVLLTSHGRSRR